MLLYYVMFEAQFSIHSVELITENKVKRPVVSLITQTEIHLSDTSIGQGGSLQ